MAIPVQNRWIVYVIALVATLAAGRWAGGQDQTAPTVTVTEPVDREARPADTPSLPEVQLAKLTQRAHAAPAGDPFESRSWQEPTNLARAATAPPPPPPPPQAPPLAFVYIGKLIDDAGGVAVFLTKQDRNYIVRVGDTIDNTYSVEAVEEERLVVKYLPLNIQQTLSFGGGAAPALNVAQAYVRQPMQVRDEDEEER